MSKPKIFTKYNRTSGSEIESYTGDRAKNLVDRTGFQPLEIRVQQLQAAGIALNVAKDASRYDTDDPNSIIEAPPFRGLSPDLAEISEIHRQNAQRMVDILDRKLEATKALAAEDNAPKVHPPSSGTTPSEAPSTSPRSEAE